MKDNFDLKRFLTENKTIEKSNPFLTESYDEFQRDDKGSKDVTVQDKGEEDAYGAGFEAGKLDALRAKIREMVLSELEDYQDYDEEEVDMGEEDLKTIFRGEYSIDNPDFNPYGDDLNEAKEDEEEESTEEEVDAEEEVDVDVTDEEAEEESGEMSVPEMEGDEGEILNHLMKALGMAKSMNDEKLIKQIGNTVTFLTRQYISGE